MVIEQQIKDYLNRISKGIINITHQQSREIINIVTGIHPGKKTALAKLYKWDPLRNEYIFLYSVPTENNKINSCIITALETRPVYQFYKWDLYNLDGEFEGSIFTVKNQLF